jgi:hypothetical protein
MPQLLPMTPGNLTGFILPDDCVRKDQPFTDFNGPTALDEQRFEFMPNGNQSDSKLLRQDLIIPYRAIVSPGGSATIAETYGEVAGNPDFYWDQVPWGKVGQLDKGAPGTPFAGQWVFTDFRGVEHDSFQSGFLTSYTIWIQSGASFDPPAWDDVVLFFQFICPQLFVPRDYQIWRVTGRWTYDSVLHPDTGTFPLPFPWSFSTDFALVSSGTLQPGQTIVVPPHDFEPSGNVQSPPAPAGFLGNPDGDGWAIGQYLVFT